MSNRGLAADPVRSADTDPLKALLRAERRRLRLSQTEVGQRIGAATYTNIHQWERGACDPSLGNFRRWAEALGFRVVLVPMDQAGGGTNG